MRQLGSRSLVVFASAVVVLTAAASLGTATPTAQSPDEETPVCTAYDRSDLSRVAVAELLSRDADSAEVEDTRDSYQNRCGHPPSDDLLLLTAFDQTWPTPAVTDRATRWTTTEFAHDWNDDTGRAVVPAGARTVRNQFIRDAHTTIFALGPSARLHRNATADRQYIAPAGRVQVVTDYREGGTTVVDRGRKRIERNVYQSTVETTCLIDGNVSALHGTGEDPCHRDSVLDRGGGHRSSLEYDFADADSDARTISVVSVIEYQANRYVDECTDWDDTRDVCDGEYEESSSQVAGSLTTVDTRTVSVYDEPTVRLQVIETPGGAEQLLVETEQPIAALAFDGARLQWPWRYYTATNGEWLSVTEYGEESAFQRPSPVRPLRVNVYPSTTGLTTPDGTSATVRATAPEQSSPADRIPATVGVDVVTRPYETPTELAVEGLPPGATDEITVIGLVDGTNYTLDRDDVGPVKTVRETDLQTTTVWQNSTHARIEVELTDTRGRPVDLRGRPGYVTVAGERVTTDDTGTARVTVRRLGVLTATYEPGSPFDVAQPYQGSQSTIQFRPNGDLVALLWTMVISLTVLLAPVWVLLYVVDGLGGATTWPPWTVFRFR